MVTFLVFETVFPSLMDALYPFRYFSADMWAPPGHGVAALSLTCTSSEVEHESKYRLSVTCLLERTQATPQATAPSWLTLSLSSEAIPPLCFILATAHISTLSCFIHQKLFLCYQNQFLFSPSEDAFLIWPIFSDDFYFRSCVIWMGSSYGKKENWILSQGSRVHIPVYALLIF